MLKVHATMPTPSVPSPRDVKARAIAEGSNLLPPLAKIVEQYAREWSKGGRVRPVSLGASHLGRMGAFDLFLNLGASPNVYIAPRGLDTPSVRCRVKLIQNTFIRFHAFERPTELPGQDELKIKVLGGERREVEAPVPWMLEQALFHALVDPPCR